MSVVNTLSLTLNCMKKKLNASYASYATQATLCELRYVSYAKAPSRSGLVKPSEL